MPIVAGVGWRKFIEQDATIGQVTNTLRSMAENNVDECQKNPALRSELFTRCRAAIRGGREGINGGLGSLPGFKNQGRPVAPFEYREEPLDEWKTWGLLAETFPGQAAIADCDCLSPAWAAFFWLRWNGDVPTGIGISQPKTRPCRCRHEGRKCNGIRCTDDGPVCETCGYGMAHAYTVLGAKQLPKEAFDTLGVLLVPMHGDYKGLLVPDGSVWAGMGKPRDDFYGSGETSIKLLRDEPEDDWKRIVNG
jgi:hypothetical protein